MSLVEVALSLGTKTRQEDGATVVWAPAKGRYFTANEINAWLGGTEPNVSTVRPNKLRDFRHLIQRVVYFTSPTYSSAVCAETRWQSNPRSVQSPWAGLSQEAKNGEIFIANKIRDAQVIWKDKGSTLGLHTEWGFNELRVFGIAVMDLSLLTITEIMTTPTDERLPPESPQHPVPKKRSYVVDYAAKLSASSLSKWQDSTVHVLPATTDPAWVDTDAWGEADLKEFTMPVQNVLGELV